MLEGEPTGFKPEEETGEEISNEEKEELITLPDEAEMLDKLKAVNDNPHMVERFYPILLKNAGQERTPDGVKLMVALAIYDYVKDLPPVMSTMMNMELDDFVEALTKKS